MIIISFRILFIFYIFIILFQKVQILQEFIYHIKRDIVSRGNRPKWILDIANERIDILFNLAEKEFFSHQERSNRYVELALKISTKYNIKIPEKWNRRYCKKCHKFLYPGQNCSIRLINSKINIKCGECGHIIKIPYLKEKKSKRRAKIDSYINKKRNNE